MSTDLQKYSTENQAAAIATYAAQHNLTIVREYADYGRSGLRMDDREALRQLISDVQSGRADFDLILVYDVSRWGRFQDTDESAYYEFICKMAGVKVLYCAEEFENDGSLLSAIIKNIKRAMAGEYSRELSAKVFAGQCRFAEMGFWQGSTPGYGLRREMVDENRCSKGLLTHGQRKYLQTDHVILRPGPPSEVRVIKRIFRDFVLKRKSEPMIARELNQTGITNHYGRPWTTWTIRYLLRNENYIGNNVYNRRTFRLRKKGKRNPRSEWIRAPRAFFEPIVDPRLFWKAQKIDARRRLFLSSEEMLVRLKARLEETGELNRDIIDQACDLPRHYAYRRRFGSLRTAYKLVGYVPGEGKFKNIEAMLSARETLAEIADKLVTDLRRSGQAAVFDKAAGVLTVNSNVTVSIFVARCIRDRRWPRWNIHRRIDPSRDFVVAARMNENNEGILDYFALPTSKIAGAKLSLSEKNRARLDSHRCGSIDALSNKISGWLRI